LGVVSGPARPKERTDRGCPSEALVILAQLVVTGAESHRLTREAARATAMTLGADLCELLRVSPDGWRLARVASSDEEAASHEPDGVPGGVSSAAGYVLLCGTPVVSGDLRHERRFGDAGAPRWDGPVSAVAAPVPGCGGTFGALVAYAARVGAFDGHQALCVARTASLLGGALERLDEYEELRRKAGEAERRPAGPTETREGLPGGENVGLTGRQLKVLGLMSAGRSAKQIALELGLSIHTVRSHQRNLYRALGVGSATGALRRAAELGLPKAPHTGSV
jgi:DNA-binding CsgD family transcriptional regulator